MNEQSMSTKVINGRYALRGELGRGGMGIVWRAGLTTSGISFQLYVPETTSAH